MNKQDFIQSGILESYALGFASSEEQEQVKQLAEYDQDISAHLVDLEDSIRSYFNKESVTPPVAIREIIQLRTERKQKHNFNKTVQDDPKRFLEVEVNDTHIKVHKYWRPAFIAVFVLSKIFLIAGLYLYFKSASQQEELLRLKQEIQQQQLK
ncbi:hypothetical protein [Dyadobacter pollutisoli]|uniref:Anti-sigma factor n=1 Tax=Dyadobacter pollutisoli TaxID=2910158 RepID=A0A9E8SLT1_9BACT|nr:hypothetical protein [Dyadobacter pollutisoli]WAC12091.1 hypothetical protein ON006_30730 [Dyadobacter pollutisoli]